MLNQVTLVGKITDDPELFESKDGRPFCTITLEIKQSFKNHETNDYKTDFIDICLWDLEAEKAVKNCGKGSIVSVRGHLEMNPLATFWGAQIFKTIGVVGNRVSFVQLRTPDSGTDDKKGGTI